MKSKLRGPERIAWRHLAAILTVLVVAACAGDGAGETTTPTGNGAEIVVWFNGETVPGDEFAALEASGVVVSYDIRGD
ncbi:MAG TPA: hypothetical protein VFT54_09770, partial [Acidimicrobiia bacterium]|nr:hypothetical protein [Acidimicrobiia bacterium]